jgi:hypothetical protein
MPHGGYHGNIEIGGNVVQSGNPDGSISGGIDNRSRLDFNPPSGNQNNQNINQQVEDKKKEIELLNIAQGGATGGVNPNIDQQVDVIDQGFFNTGITAGSSMPGGLAPGSMFPITGATGDTSKGLATLQNIQNQQLNNLLQQQQEINLANQIKDSFAKYGSDKETADNLRKLFTGDLGDKSFFGVNLGSTEQPAATVINPYTGERITTGKIREGMTSPEYAEYMSELYDLNPALMEQIFPFGSGQIAKPIFARIGEGIMGIPGVSELGQLASSVISPLSGLFTGQSTATPKIQYDNMGNAIGIINPKASTDGGGIPQAVPEGMDMSIYGSFIGKPGPFTKDFIDQDGDGVDDRLQSGPGEAKAPPYSPPKQPVNILPSTGLPAIADYASIAPQFRGSEYTNQGVSPEFLENLRKFYG